MDINRRACFFHGRFASESRERPEALAPLGQQILLWQGSWRKETGPPALSLTRAAASLSGDVRVARLLDRGLLVAVDDVLLSVVCETDEV